MNKTIVVIIGIMAAACLASCGAKPDTAGEEDAANNTVEVKTEEVTEGTSMEIAMAEGSISKYLLDGKLSIGIDEEYPLFMNANNRETDGLGMDLIMEIGSRLHADVEIKNIKSNDLITEVGNATDISMVRVSAEMEKTDNPYASELLFDSVQVVLLPQGSSLGSREDMLGRTIGCVPYTEAEAFVDELGAEDGTTEKRVYTNAEGGIKDLLSGEIDAFVIEQLAVQEYNNHEDLRISDGRDFDIENERYVIVVPKGDPVLMEQINTILNEMKEDGTTEQLVEKYSQDMTN